jgi:hypothetical protein
MGKNTCLVTGKKHISPYRSFDPKEYPINSNLSKIFPESSDEEEEDEPLPNERA